VVQAVNEINAKIIFFSSDYVFDGVQGPYSEDDPAHPISEYGNQKLIGEHYIAFHSKNYLIIRTTVVYGWETQGKNFVQRLIKSLRDGERIRVPVDQIGNPTFAPNLAEAVIELATGGETGICNIVGSTLVSRYEFAVTIAKAFDLDPLLIVPVSTEELGQVAQRPLSAGLRVDKAQKILRTSLLGYLEGLRIMAVTGEDL
jgi:dTDP-4-dehydrorhamnose reductase